MSKKEIKIRHKQANIPQKKIHFLKPRAKKTKKHSCGKITLPASEESEVFPSLTTWTLTHSARDHGGVY